MDKIVILLLVTLVIVVVLLWASGWRSSDRKAPISRIPLNRNKVGQSEDFLSQTLNTSVFELYRLFKTNFGYYDLEIGYKSKPTGPSWVFKTTTSEIRMSLDSWLSCYHHMFPISDFRSFELPQELDLIAISMEVNEDTLNVEGVEHLSLLFREKDDKNAFQEFVLGQENGSFKMVANSTSKESNFDETQRQGLISVVEERGWKSKSHILERRGDQVAIHLLKPSVETVRSYLEIFRPQLSMSKDEVLKNIHEIVLNFEVFPNRGFTLWDEFYVKI